ncbi:MAG: assimilatory sulfite reductase (NADPH) flavoprotein subunit [Xanthomonadaceae bacterium]|nr:assimilatory sulfite reductase (NADPH) flavoprotein subunit [Xanthomonadaceae bacterium]
MSAALAPSTDAPLTLPGATTATARGETSLLPLSQDQALLLARLTERLEASQLWWLSGYAAGLAAGRTDGGRASTPDVVAGVEANPGIASTAADPPRLTVVYGSQTGNAKRVAEALAQRLSADGLPVRLLRADAYPLRELANERYLAIAISTQGDGDPPDDARGFVEHLLGKRAPKLPQLKFAVLGLGDSSYPQFCAIGRRLDERLAELGGERWLDRADADLDIDTIAAPWLDSVQRRSSDALTPRPAAPSATVTPLRPVAPTPERWSRERPFAAEVLTNQRIVGRDSGKDIRHLEIGLDGTALDGGGLDYEPGDALGVWPQNPPALVDALIDALGVDGDAVVAVGERERPLRDWLAHEREITRLSRPFLAAHAARAPSDALQHALSAEGREALARLFAEWQVLDLLRAHPARWEPNALIDALRPLQPRMYSIASSRKAVGDEAHLTVAHIEYAHGGETRWGAASHFLARAEEGASLPVFLERNERFRLPADPSRDILMIGPGTGVAPFRGFVQEREAVGASGRNWLVFGNPHARSDFLYQTEWQDALRRGALHRLSLAFSRDQAQKVYVQHALREQGREVYDWLQNGAHLYVCGDATRMAKDVHATLIEIVAEHGGLDAEGAGEYIATLAAQGRYARDIY